MLGWSTLAVPARSCLKVMDGHGSGGVTARATTGSFMTGNFEMPLSRAASRCTLSSPASASDQIVIGADGFGRR